MTFGEKLKTVRLSLNLSQSDLAEKTGISERSLYTYEQTGILPRSNNLRKLADALNVSVSYLLDEEEIEPNKDINHSIFIANVKKYAGWIGEFIVLAGDFEMEALASGAIRALNKEEELLEYTGVPVWTHFDFEPAD